MAAPTLIVTALVIWVGMATGAMMSAQSWARAQSRDPHLVVLPPYIKYWAPLKLARIAETQPEVIFIGTSRCQEFRSAMLRPYPAYNACLSAWTLRQNMELLRRVFAVSHPKIVILALDYFLFTDVWEDGYQVERAADYDPGYHQILHGIHDTLSAFWLHPREMFDIAPRAVLGPQYEPQDHDRLLGVDAIRGGFGFRSDGSFLFSRGRFAQAATDAQNLSLFNQAFPGGPAVSPAQFEKLRDLATLVQQNGATLVGIQLPFFKNATEFLDQTADQPGYGGVWKEFESAEFRQKLAAIGIPFFDLARDPVSQDYRYFIDPAHPGEAAILCSLSHLLDNKDFVALFPKLDGDAMRRTCASSVEQGNYFSVYHNEF